jgi:hypothetical protein
MLLLTTYYCCENAVGTGQAICPLCAEVQRAYGDDTVSKQSGFDVFRNGEWVDTVFFNGHTAEEVRVSLINHDGYDPNIKVRPSTGKTFKNSKRFDSHGHSKKCVCSHAG